MPTDCFKNVLVSLGNKDREQERKSVGVRMTKGMLFWIFCLWEPAERALCHSRCISVSL